MEAKTPTPTPDIDLATVCRGLLLRVGLAASATAVMLGLLAADVIPRLKNIDYLKAGLHVDSAVTLAPLLCSYAFRCVRSRGIGLVPCVSRVLRAVAA